MASRKTAHTEENGKLGGGGMAVVQCARGPGASRRLQDLPVPDGEHSVAAAAALSMHQQVCHSERMQGEDKEERRGKNKGENEGECETAY